MTFRLHLFKACTLATLGFSQAACAGGIVGAPESVLLKNADGQYNHWNGIGKLLYNGEPSCTASLLDTRNDDNKATGPAYLLTDGHCALRRYDPNPDATLKLSVTFNYFNDTLDSHKSYEIHKVNWTTFSNTDFAIVELATPFDTLLKDGITPLKLSTDAASIVGDILIVGAPHGLPETGLRLATCTQEPTDAVLVQSGLIYPDTRKNNCQGIRAGSDGSPVLEPKTGKIAGMIFTSTYDAKPENLCFNGSPCEVKDTNLVLANRTNYSNPTDFISDCFINGHFDLESKSCTLKPAFKFDSVYGRQSYRSMPATADEEAPTWDTFFSLNTPFYRFKPVRDAKACYSPREYSGVISASDASIQTPIGREAGMYFLCVLGVESAKQRPTTAWLKNAEIIPVLLVEPAPARMPEPTIKRTTDGNYHVTWRTDHPLFFNIHYYAGPADTTDCAGIERKDFSYFSGSVTFNAEQLPLALCSYNKNLALSNSEVRTDLLPQASKVLTDSAP